jgi:hypothetical protein
MRAATFIAGQLRRPSGFFGRLVVGRILNRVNAPMNELTLKLRREPLGAERSHLRRRPPPAVAGVLRARERRALNLSGHVDFTPARSTTWRDKESSPGTADVARVGQAPLRTSSRGHLRVPLSRGRRHAPARRGRSSA